jgi:AmmeMemoRadiSam system protein A
VRPAERIVEEARMAAPVFGVISPHPPIFVPAVGGGRATGASSSLDGLAQAAAALAKFAPETIVLMSPHAPAVYDTFLVDASELLAGDLAQFGDNTVRSRRGDPEMAAALIERLDAEDVPVAARDADPRLRAGWLDHATIVPLSFLEPSGTVPVVVLSLSFLSYATHRRVGEVVEAVAGELGRRVAFVASGDLSHRLTRDAPAGYSERAAELDSQIVSLVSQGRLSELLALDPELVEAGGECGLRSIITLGGFAGDDPVRTSVLAYEGPWGVGYLTALVGEEALDASSHATATAASGRKGGMPGSAESEIVSLARASIGHFLLTGTELPSPTLSGAEYPTDAGAFVSLHRKGMLRGCIGTIQPTYVSLAEEVAHNAVQAATRDPRFPPLDTTELPDLEIKVDVLFAPETCTIADLDPLHYGVIVTNGWRRGLLLPDLEGVDDVAQQVSIALQKAGISPDEGCNVERFRVDRYT